MIASGAFSDARYIRDLVLPSSLVSIGQQAFAGCGQLESLVFEGGIQLTTIPFGCFQDCAKLTEVTIPDSVTGIEGLAFFGCENLADIHIPGTVTSILGMALPGSAKVHGTYGSAAWQYAMDNGQPFEAVGGTEVTALGISLDLGADHVEPGTVLPISATVSPENASLNGEISWTISDSTLAFIYDGEIHFLSPGEVIIQAAAPNGVFDSLEVSIRVDTQAIELNHSELFLLPGQDTWLRAAFTPMNATDQTLVWSSADESVVHVTQTGHLIPQGTGNALVTAETAGGLTASCLVHVADIRLSASSLTLEAGQAVRPEILVTGDLGSVSPAWTSGSGAVSVADGVLTAVSAGSADVQCSIGNLVFHLQVTVVGSLSTLQLPASLETVEESAFEGTAAVGRVILPASVQSIESLAFAQMPALRQLILPDASVSLSGDCLSGSPGAVILYRNGTPADSGIPYVFLID